MQRSGCRSLDPGIVRAAQAERYVSPRPNQVLKVDALAMACRSLKVSMNVADLSRQALWSVTFGY